MIFPGTFNRALRARVVRMRERMGWVGLAGLIAFFASAGVGTLAWHDREETLASHGRAIALTQDRRSAGAAQGDPSRADAPIDPRPARRDVPDLLLRLEAIAVANGLGWSAADYRILPAGNRASASLEVRTRLSGSYPQVRRMIAQALRDIPALTFRQLSLARPDGAAPAVEAKIAMAILLQDGPPATAGGADATAGAAP